MPATHYSFFTGRMPFLPPNQQHQSTEGTFLNIYEKNSPVLKEMHKKKIVFFQPHGVYKSTVIIVNKQC